MVKGRDKLLVEKRDEALLRRYHYWTEIQRLRFDDALKILSHKEFFISEERIMAIVRANCNKLDDIKIMPVPKVRKPKITEDDLRLLTE
ncbi:transposase [Bacteroides sp. 51]|uniref:transposase n=1 Tax=Bacteroides sp. 51 TaxID=2302938 RepID=UPI0013D6A293|nr:transposase [Bacteroides sp. 51]NDV83093.1 transposase [Bacteroides sp. 51]